MKGRQKVTRANHSARIHNHFATPLLNLFQKAVPILLASFIFQTCPSYFTFNNKKHEFYHIKRKHDSCVVSVSAVSKMPPMITNSLRLFSLLRVRPEAHRKQR